MSSSSTRLAVLLACLAAIGPFAIDTYLPAFNAMGEALAATPLQVQQTLSAYMATLAIMSLWHGTLADYFGRRIVIIAAMGVFTAASLTCALAPSIEWLWAGRALQGMAGGAGMIVGRAIIRDLFDGARAQKLMSKVMMMFGIAPALAPLIGGILLTLAGWRSIFLFLALFSASLCWASWRFLPETLTPQQRQSMSLSALGKNYRQILTNAPFLLLSVTIAFAFNGFFIYVLSAPVFIMKHLGLEATQFGWLFFPTVAGMVLGSMLSGRVAGRWSHMRTIAVGFSILVAAALINVLYSAFVTPGVPGSVIPISIYCLGVSLMAPSVTLLALDIFPTHRGLASSCQSFVQIGTNTITSGLFVPLLWATPLSLSAGVCLFLSMGLITLFLWRRGIDKTHDREAWRDSDTL